MSNPFATIGHGLETAAKDVAHVCEEIVHVATDIVAVLEDTQKLTPAFKTELAMLIADVQPIAGVLSPVIAANGTNIALDLAAIAPTLADIKKLVADFISFLPTLKAAVAQLEADVK